MMNYRPTSRIPLFHRLAASIERRAQKAQGKGAGGHSIEAEVAEAHRFLPKQGAIVIDAGANRGLWSQAMVALGGGQIERLIAFEPSRHNWPEIERIDFQRFTLVKKGLADKCGTAVLYMDAPGSGLASLTQRNLEHVGLTMSQCETIELDTLDDYCAQAGIERIDFLKLDIEGHEFNALSGAKRLLDNGAIHALSFEFGGANIDTRTYFRDFWLLLSSYDYAIWRIVPGGSPTPIHRYHERLECFATTNYLAALRP